MSLISKTTLQSALNALIEGLTAPVLALPLFLLAPLAGWEFTEVLIGTWLTGTAVFANRMIAGIVSTATIDSAALRSCRNSGPIVEEALRTAAFLIAGPVGLIAFTVSLIIGEAIGYLGLTNRALPFLMPRAKKRQVLMTVAVLRTVVTPSMHSSCALLTGLLPLGLGSLLALALHAVWNGSAALQVWLCAQVTRYTITDAELRKEYLDAVAQ